MTTRPIHGGNLAWAAQLVGCSPHDFLDFSASISPLGPPQSVLACLQDSLSMLVRYPDPDYAELRGYLARYHGLDPDWIFPGNGAAELLTWASRDFSFSVSGCYGFVPAFGDYTRALRSYEVPWLPLPLLHDNVWKLKGVDWEALLVQALNPPTQSSNSGTSDKAWGLLINNPHNPSGILFSREVLRPYFDQFALVVIDEAFMDFLPPDQSESVVDWVPEFENLVVLRSQTKFYSIPGLRIGYAIAHPDRLQRWKQWRDPWSVNSLAAAAAVAGIQDTAFQARTWAWLPSARAQLFQALQQIPALTPLPGAANFLLVHCKSSVCELQEKLLRQHRIFIRDCLSFPELGDRYFRVAVRTESDNQRLISALRTELKFR